MIFIRKKRTDFPVDMVILWCNGNEAGFLAEKEYWAKQEGVENKLSNHQARFIENDELSNRGYYIPPLVDRQLRFLIWDICRLRKLSANKQKEHDLLLGKGLAYLRRDKEFCSFYGRWRVSLFLWICGQPGSKWFYFWAKVFR